MGLYISESELTPFIWVSIGIVIVLVVANFVLDYIILKNKLRDEKEKESLRGERLIKYRRMINNSQRG